MSLYTRFAGPGSSGFGPASTAEDVTEGLDLSGRTILVTGFANGLGRESARVLALRGATVVGIDRTSLSAEVASQKLPGDVRPVGLDLAEPREVCDWAFEFRDSGETLDAVVANAAIQAIPECRMNHGYELHFLISCVSHFILHTTLLEALSPDGRIVYLSSTSHRAAPDGPIEVEAMRSREAYDPQQRYCEVKLAQIWYANEFARRFERDPDHERIAVSLCPGRVNTSIHWQAGIWQKLVSTLLMPFEGKTLEQGAATQVWAAVHPDAAAHNGAFLEDCNVSEPSEHAQNAEQARALWEQTERVVGELCPDWDAEMVGETD